MLPLFPSYCLALSCSFRSSSLFSPGHVDHVSTQVGYGWEESVSIYSPSTLHTCNHWTLRFIAPPISPVFIRSLPAYLFRRPFPWTRTGAHTDDERATYGPPFLGGQAGQLQLARRCYEPREYQGPQEGPSSPARQRQLNVVSTDQQRRGLGPYQREIETGVYDCRVGIAARPHERDDSSVRSTLSPGATGHYIAASGGCNVNLCYIHI